MKKEILYLYLGHYQVLTSIDKIDNGYKPYYNENVIWQGNYISI